jgi:hypothetical protein
MSPASRIVPAVTLPATITLSTVGYAEPQEALADGVPGRTAWWRSSASPLRSGSRSRDARSSRRGTLSS